MKKIIYSMIMSLFLLFLASISSYAADEPNYVKNFDTNVDVLYANGTDIVIDVNEENQTVGSAFIKMDKKTKFLLVGIVSGSLFAYCSSSVTSSDADDAYTSWKVNIALSI